MILGLFPSCLFLKSVFLFFSDEQAFAAIMQLWLKVDKADSFKFILLNMIISSFLLEVFTSICQRQSEAKFKT